MKMEKPQPTRADAALLRNTVFKLTAPRRAVTIAVLVIVALVWWSLLHKVIAFGKGLDYSGLEALGPQVKHIVQQYNPFFWWAIVALCTLIDLSPGAVQVLQWSWQDRREPITVGVLQRTQRQLQNGRAARIELAERHAALLDTAAAQSQDDNPLPNA